MKNILVLITVFLTGCIPIPIPHTVPVTPGTRGVVLIDGNPLVGKIVFISLLQNCQSSLVETTTDESGMFKLKRTSKFQLYAGIMEHHVSTWSVCLKVDEKKSQEIYQGYAYSMGGASMDNDLVCTLDKTQKNGFPCIEKYMLEDGAVNITKGSN